MLGSYRGRGKAVLILRTGIFIVLCLTLSTPVLSDPTKQALSRSQDGDTARPALRESAAQSNVDSTKGSLNQPDDPSTGNDNQSPDEANCD